MLAGAVRSEKLYVIFSEKVESSDFNEYEQYLAVIWEQVIQFYSEFKRLPSKTELAPLIEREQVTSQRFDDHGWSELVQFFNNMYQLDEDKLISEDVMRQWTAAFKVDRVTAALKSVIDDPTSIPVDISNLAQQYVEEVNTAATVHRITDRDIVPFPVHWESKDRIEVLTSGIPFVDALIDGGLANKLAYSLMGPFGSCKTTLAIQLSVSMAKVQAKRWRYSGRQVPLGKIFFVTGEEPPTMLRYRAIAHAANIESDVLMGRAINGYFRSLSCGTDLCDRDRLEFAELIARGIAVPSEQERKRQAEYALNENWRLLDFRANAETDSVAPITMYPTSRIVQTITSVLETDAREGKPSFCAGVLIDYAGTLIDDYVATRTYCTDREAQRFLERFPKSAKIEIADALNCPVIVLHQLSGKANAKREGIIARHTEAAGSKSWAANFDFCLQISVPTNDGVCMIGCSKHRYSSYKPEQILRILGERSTVVSAASTHKFDARTQRIMAIDSDEALQQQQQKKTELLQLRPAKIQGREVGDVYDAVFTY
jgi:hypothetical protein